MLSTSGKAIVTLPRVGLKVPRGSYDIEMYDSLLRFKGSQSFTVLYDNITRISWMKTTDERHFYIVVRSHRCVSSATVLCANLGSSLLCIPP